MGGAAHGKERGTRDGPIQGARSPKRRISALAWERLLTSRDGRLTPAARRRRRARRGRQGNRRATVLVSISPGPVREGRWCRRQGVEPAALPLRGERSGP
jgi:hypothetical protein